jgi:hypothetical protein
MALRKPAVRTVRISVILEGALQKQLLIHHSGMNPTNAENCAKIYKMAQFPAPTWWRMSPSYVVVPVM